MRYFKIRLLPGQKLWFASDYHYNHPNIVRGITKWGPESATRDFDTLYEMNACIVKNTNDLVGEDDILIHAGDWSFGGFDSIAEFRNQIICKNIYEVLGNHDHHIKKNKNDIQSIFTCVDESLMLQVISDDFDVMLYVHHFPHATWPDIGKGVIHIHGHVHPTSETRFGPGKMLDVGIDGNDFKPTELSWIVEQMNKRPIASLLNDDRHERESY